MGSVFMQADHVAALRWPCGTKRSCSSSTAFKVTFSLTFGLLNVWLLNSVYHLIIIYRFSSSADRSLLLCLQFLSAVKKIKKNLRKVKSLKLSTCKNHQNAKSGHDVCVRCSCTSATELESLGHMTLWRLITVCCVAVVVASQCWQGATFPGMVVSPDVESSGILRVPGVVSLPQCVAASCDLPGYDLAWLFEGRCYVLTCQQRENCQPRQRPGADSILAFLRRASPQALMLQSLVRGEQYGGRWRPLSRSSGAPENLGALEDLALLDRPRQDLSIPGVLGVDQSEDSREEGGVHSSEAESLTDQTPLTGDKFNQSEAYIGSEEGVVQNKSSVTWSTSEGDQDKSSRPMDPAAETTVSTKVM